MRDETNTKEISMTDQSFVALLEEVLGSAQAAQFEMERKLEDAYYDEMAQEREDSIAIVMSEFGEWLSEMESME
tara:strand:- start:452 stop:673 length:222 start_codon:yes stop_codon:yes gene_type:complete